jgi:hypothetical protein
LRQAFDHSADRLSLAKRCGNKRSVNVREIANGSMY